MKQKKLLAVAALLSMSAFGFSDAHAGASANGDAYAAISNSIGVTTTATALNFGTIIPDASASGTVTVASNTGVGATPTLSIVTMSSVASCSPGHFNVTGDPSTTFSITLPSSAQTISHATVSGAEMTVSNFEYTAEDGAGGTTTTSPKTLGTGLATFTVGAKLAVGQNQLSGSYRGQYQVTVAYAGA